MKFITTTCPVCENNKFSTVLTCKDHFVSGEEFSIKACTTCGFRITADPEDDSNIGRYYQSEEYISHSDTAKGIVNRIYHAVRKYMLRKKRELVQKNAPSASGRILDIGCGTGYFLNEMKQHGWAVTGIEKDTKAREFASNTFQMECFPTEKLYELPDKNYQVITLWHVLEHVHDLKGYLQRCNEMLTEDGLLVLALPNFTSYDARHYKAFWAAYDVPRHLWHFAPEHISKLALAYGFELKGVKPMPFDAFYVSLLSEKYKQNKFSLLSGFFHGKLSWLNALFNPKKCSSVIYLFNKQNGKV